MRPAADASPSVRRAMITRGWLVAALVFAVLAALAVPAWMLRTMTKMPAPATAVALQNAAPGSPVDVVVLATGAVRDGAFSGRVLDANADGSYRATAAVVTIARTDVAHFEMGSAAAIQPGAVAAVHGSMSQRGARVEATRIVILTGYATVR